MPADARSRKTWLTTLLVSTVVAVLTVCATVVTVSAIGADAPTMDDPYLTAPEPTYLNDVSPVPWVVGAPTRDVFVRMDELPWTDARDASSADYPRYAHRFCRSALPSDHDLGTSEDDAWRDLSSTEDGGWIFVDQELWEYDHPIGSIAVGEIRDMVSTCEDYEVPTFTKAPTLRNESASFSSCGLVDLGVTVPDATVLGYCETGHDPKGDYTTIHTYIGIDRWLIAVRVAHWDRTEAEQRAAEFVRTVAERLQFALAHRAPEPDTSASGTAHPAD